MKRFTDLVTDCLDHVDEVFPWDLVGLMKAQPEMLVLDVREKDEFDAAHIAGSLHVPRGILESACEYGYEETVPELVQARQRPIVLVCRSGNRSVLAADTLQRMGFEDVNSLKTGLRGWNDYEQPLQNADQIQVDIDEADEYFAPKLTPEQLGNSAA